MHIALSRLLVNPAARVLSRDGDITLIRVDGMVCSGVCAARTRRALRRLPGVQRVQVDHASGIASVVGTPHDADVYDRAVASAVVGRPIRRAVERIARSVGRRLRSRGAPAR